MPFDILWRINIKPVASPVGYIRYVLYVGRAIAITVLMAEQMLGNLTPFHMKNLYFFMSSGQKQKNVQLYQQNKNKSEREDQ